MNGDALLDQRSVLGHNIFAYCFNNSLNYKDSTGTRCAKNADCGVPSWFLLSSVTVELGAGWEARIDPQKTQKKVQRHIHVKKNGKKYSQNQDGSSHDKHSSKGSPPKKVKEEIKDRLGWDWDANENRYSENLRRSCIRNNIFDPEVYPTMPNQVTVYPINPIIPIMESVEVFKYFILPSLVAS